MQKVILAGIDIAKDIFQLHGVDASGEAVVKKRLRRGQLLQYVATKLAPCLIVMEACGGSHHWAREFKKLGCEVKLISPQFVKPFVKTNKNDAADAEAIVIAARQPGMRFVPIKTLDQQGIQCVHRVRSRLVSNRTELGNQIRGMLSEYGIVFAEGITNVKKGIPRIVEDAENNLPDVIRSLCCELYEDLKRADERIKECDNRIKQIFDQNPICKRLAQIEGIGPITATILLTVLGDPSLFKNGRHFAAYLGLVPKQSSSGGKQRLLGISKRGDTYIRNLLIHGGRSVVKNLKQKQDKRSQWARQLKERRGYNRTAVAVANKNARIVWSVVANEADYKKAV